MGQIRVQNAVLGYNLKNDRMIYVRFQGKPFNTTVIQVYAPTSNAEEAEVERFYEDLQDLLELTPKKDVLFIFRSDQIRSEQSLSRVHSLRPHELQHLDYCDIEWFTLETNRDHSVVFEIASKYCISDSLLTMMATPFLLRDSCLQ